MSPAIVLLVLAAAAMHATWNALLKAGNDKIVLQCLVALVPALPAMLALPFFPLPAPAAWGYLILSTVVHGVYYALLVNSYRHGDLSQVYPLARGAAPLLIALGAGWFAAEAMLPLQWLGIAVVSLGIASLAAPGRLRRGQDTKAIGFALATGLSIAAYSLADGLGVRASPEPMSYILWLLVLEALPMVPIALWLRRGRIAASFKPQLARGAVGGLVLGLGYGIVIWAMGQAPMGSVSALRETSVILAAVIGTVFLGESFGRRRAIAAAMVAGGNALLHLA